MKKLKVKQYNSWFKKIFIQICRFIGYEIIDQNNLFLPVTNKNAENRISQQGIKSITLPLGIIKITRPVKSLDIILRTCASVKLVNQSKERLFEKEKFVYSIKTLKSILNSINFSKDKLKNIEISITIIDDRSEPKILDEFKSILANHQIKSKILNLDVDKYKPQIKQINDENKKVTEDMLLNMSSIHQSFELAENFKDLIYFVEDDYIHKKETILEMVLTYEKLSTQLNSELFLCPSDYPFLYTNMEKNSILLGDKSHWREINQTLLTFLTSKKLLDKYLNEFKNMCTFENRPFEKPLHKIYEKEYCFSPIPSLAMHCSNINSIYGIPPNLDWKKFWDEEGNF
tara:strand:+ start:1234 stop:2265 length:1032 start_codon:yes stop_codon:yes gene_type:complete